ncbi:exosome complex component RRP4 [Caerostris extrusa]|uniref:Exosome complex component RRP4 n=1 Tax=Caerostris extrusa TaxID=172846 RepID=A0AAV4NJ00_CAEEX|nr:exosome complex component RRP4 [Caerostris extrusa]
MLDIKLIKEVNEVEFSTKRNTAVVTPGCVISSVSGFMRGHGTWLDENENLCSTVAGNVERINKLYSVRPLRSRYNGEVGDVAIGRIAEVRHKKWSVDANARLNAILLLSSVNLPAGELRRKTEEDELMMRHHFEVEDLISLSQGVLVKVPSSLIQRGKIHFHNIVSGVQIILSNNGYIWISPTTGGDVETGGFTENFEHISKSVRKDIARLRNCILALVAHNKQLYSTIILYAYEASLSYGVKQLRKPDIIKEVVDSVMQRMEVEVL